MRNLLFVILLFVFTGAAYAAPPYYPAPVMRYAPRPLLPPYRAQGHYHYHAYPYPHYDYHPAPRYYAPPRYYRPHYHF